MRQGEWLSQPQGGEGPDDDVAPPARLDIVRPPLDVLDLGVPDALLSDRGEVVVDPLDNKLPKDLVGPEGIDFMKVRETLPIKMRKVFRCLPFLAEMPRQGSRKALVV